MVTCTQRWLHVWGTALFFFDAARFYSLTLLYSTMVTCTQRWLHVLNDGYMSGAALFSLTLLYPTMVTCPGAALFFFDTARFFL